MRRTMSVVNVSIDKAGSDELAAGILFGFNDALITTVTKNLDHGIVAVLTNWPVYSLVVVLVLGTYLQQASYQAGALQASLPSSARAPSPRSASSRAPSTAAAPPSRNPSSPASRPPRRPPCGRSPGRPRPGSG